MGLTKDLAIFGSQFGGSRQKHLEGEVEKDRSTIASAVETIYALYSDQAALPNLEVEELNRIYATMGVQLAAVSSIRQKFEAKAASLSEQLRPYREKAINT